MAQRNVSVAAGGGQQLFASPSALLFSSAAQRQAWLSSRSRLSESNRERLDLILCRYLRDLPPYFAPACVAAFKARYRPMLPLQLLAELGMSGSAELKSAPAPASRDASQSEQQLQEAVRAELEGLLSLRDPSGLERADQYALPASTRMNELITSEMLLTFRCNATLHSRLDAAASHATFYGVPLRSSSDERREGSAIPADSDAPPLPALTFLRRFARRYMSDEAQRSALAFFVWPVLTSSSRTAVCGFVEPLSETTNGSLSFWAATGPGEGRATATAMTSSTVAHRSVSGNMKELRRYAHGMPGAAPATGIWASQDMKEWATSGVMKGADAVLCYLPPAAAPQQPSSGQEENQMLQLMAALKATHTQEPQQQSTDTTRDNYAGPLDTARAPRLLVLFVHATRWPAVRQAAAQADEQLFGRKVLEQVVRDDLVGDVVLLLSILKQ
jgi:hypothetical protein